MTGWIGYKFEFLAVVGVARIPDEVLARLKAEVSVARLVEGVGVQLRRQGKDLVGRCPFHEDGTPSLVISPVATSVLAPTKTTPTSGYALRMKR